MSGSLANKDLNCQDGGADLMPADPIGRRDVRVIGPPKNWRPRVDLSCANGRRALEKQNLSGRETPRIGAVRR